MSSSVEPTTSLAARRDRRRPPEIALIGSRSSFSDSLVRATGKDLRELSLVHVSSLEEFNLLPSAQTRWLRLVLLDDVTVRNATPEAIDEFTCPPASSIVLAFLDHDLASSLYQTADKVLPIDSYIPLDVRLDVWLSILKLLLHGGKYVPEELAAAHQPEARHHPARGRGPDSLGLTPRQYGVLELVSEGLPNKLIASRLGLSDHTVKLHIHNIISKLGVTNRTEAAARFHGEQ